MKTNDIFWFLSATAQSMAAIIAFVGSVIIFRFSTLKDQVKNEQRLIIDRLARVLPEEGERLKELEREELKFLREVISLTKRSANKYVKNHSRELLLLQKARIRIDGSFKTTIWFVGFTFIISLLFIPLVRTIPMAQKKLGVVVVAIGAVLSLYKVIRLFLGASLAAQGLKKEMRKNPGDFDIPS